MKTTAIRGGRRQGVDFTEFGNEASRIAAAREAEAGEA